MASKRDWRIVVALLAIGVCASTHLAATSQSVQLDAVLAAAARYLAQLSNDVNGVVILEDYLQQAQAQTVSAKRLRSDLAFMADETFGWIEFRDTFEVDGKAVTDRQARVVELFSHPSPAALEQARRIVREGARFNLAAVGSSFDRTINLPMAALAFLRAANQPRVSFSRESFENVGGQRMAVVSFRETAKPRLIGSPDEAPASGRFWIEPTSGEVRRTLLRIESRRGTTAVAASIRVDYVAAPSLGLWLPKVMEEDYQFTNSATRQIVGMMAGRANYSNYRRFRVAVNEQSAPAESAAPK